MSRIARTLLLAFMLVVATASSAQAAESISLSFGPDPTEEVPLAINVSWTADNATAELYVTIKPSGPLGCQANWAADSPNATESIFGGSSTNAATGTQARNHTLNTPGTYTLCGYLQSSSSATSPRAVTGPVSLVVRSARATLALQPPARVDAGATFALNAPLTSELRRELYVTIKPAGGRGCEATWSLDSPNATESIFGGTNVQGAQTATRNYVASKTNGTYLLCGYVQESSSDPAPEATASATFLVGPDPCVTARTALTAAQKRVKTAETSVTRNKSSWKKYDKRAKKAHGSKRKSLAKQAKKYKSRYTSAVRKRATERGKLATAQQGVTAACGG